MVVVALTGGIGSGKSTVARMLAGRGAVVVDADAVARDVVAPGGAAHASVLERFGRKVLAPDGGIDRAALAAVVFSDGPARADLEAITHPAIRDVIDERVAAERGSGRIVVLEIPLLTESGRRWGEDAVVVVDCPEDEAVRRVVAQRGMAPGEAQARVAAQAAREDRLALADFVVDNSGDRDDLAREVDRCWRWLARLAAGLPGPELGY